MAIFFIGYTSKQNENNRYEIEIEQINSQELTNRQGFLIMGRNIFRKFVDGIGCYLKEIRNKRFGINKMYVFA